MKKIIDDNQMSSSFFEIGGKGIIPEEAILRNITPSYRKNSEDTERVLIGWIVECVDAVTASIFKIRVENKDAVISPKDFEEAENLIVIQIPVQQVKIKPYSIEYGKAKVSISVPYIKLKEEK